MDFNLVPESLDEYLLPLSASLKLFKDFQVLFVRFSVFVQANFLVAVLLLFFWATGCVVTIAGEVWFIGYFVFQGFYFCDCSQHDSQHLLFFSLVAFY